MFQQSLMAEMFRQETKKFKDPSMASEVTVPVGYMSTFMGLDYKNGMLVSTENIMNGDIYQNYSLGFGDGTINMIIGKTGSAKTTFAQQAAAAIVAPFKNSVIIHEDIERGASKPRICNVTGWTPGMVQSKYILRQAGITAESFYQRVKLHCDLKVEAADKHPEQMTYWTGLLDSYGKKVIKIIPTVIILDSLPLLMPEDIAKEDELAGQMSVTAQAKKNAQIFRTIAPHLNKANVILFVINHINQKININSFVPTQAQINYLKQDESLPGGYMALYLSNNIIKFTTSDKLKEEKEFGINGFMSKVELIKSRTNRAGQELRMVYNQDYGFDRLLSNYVMLKDNDLIRGAGTSFYVDGCESIKFSQKRFLEKFYDEPKLRYAMKQLCVDLCQTYVPKKFESSDTLTEDEVVKRLAMSYREVA